MSVRGFNTGSGVEQYDYEYLDNKPEIPTKKSDIGLGNVDNTSDLDKPISNETQTALNEKVPNSRKVNGKALSSDVTLTSGDIGYDSSSTYNTGTVGEKLSELNRQISEVATDVIGYNPYYSYTIIKDEYVTVQGVITPYQGWDRTDYIPLVGDILYITIKMSGNSYNCFYDESKNFISNFQTATGGTVEIPIPSNAKYVILSAGAGESWTLKANIPNNLKELGSQTSNLKSAIDLETVNVSTNLIDNRGMAGKTPAELFGFASGNYVAYIPLVWGANTAEGSFMGYFVLNDGTSDQSNLNAIQLTFCDENKTAITGDLTQNYFNNVPINLARTAKYIKLTMYNWYNYAIVKFGICKSDYTIYTEEIVSARLNNIETDITALGETSEEHSNILDDISQPVYNGSYFDFSNYIERGLFGANSLFAGSGATFDIDISELGLTGKYISTFLWKDDDTSYITGYITENQLDSNGNQIYPTSGYHYVGNPVQILDGCTTIRLTATANAYNNWGSAELTHAQLWTSGSEKLDFSISYKPNEVNAWAGKKWVSYGDSITQLGTYQQFVANKIGFSVVNAGLGGSAVADGTDISVASFTDPTRISALPVDADVVTIMGGTNDYNMTNSGAGSPIGSLPTSATFDTTTFIGALCQTVKLIQTQCPNALIIICGNIGGRGNAGQVTGYQLVNSLGLTCVDYAKAAKSVAEYMGIPYIPTDECGINPFNRLSYITDSVHPNTAGAELISRPIIAYFETNQPN